MEMRESSGGQPSAPTLGRGVGDGDAGKWQDNEAGGACVGGGDLSQRGRVTPGGGSPCYISENAKALISVKKSIPTNTILMEYRYAVNWRQHHERHHAAVV